MPWTNSHLHHFIFTDTLYSDPRFYTEDDPDWPNIQDESQALLRKVAVHDGCVFAYLYDFGANWRHLIYVDHILGNSPPYPGHLWRQADYESFSGRKVGNTRFGLTLMA